MKQVKRVFCMLLVMVLVFTGFAEPIGLTAHAEVENVPTVGGGEVGDTPDELLTLGEWVYFVEDGTATVAGYLDPDVGSLQIPARLGGYAVTGIGHRAFSDNTALGSIQIPTNVTRIAEDAFEGLQLTVTAYHGAYALRYAEKKGFGASAVAMPGVVFQTGVLDLRGLPAGAYHSLNESGVVFKADEATFLAVGQVLSFPKSAAFPTGLAMRVDAVSESGGELIVALSKPEWGEVFENVSGEEELNLDWSKAIVYDGFELEDVDASGSLYKHKYSIDYEFSRNAKVIGSITVDIGKPVVSYDVGMGWWGAIPVPKVKKVQIDVPITSDISAKLDVHTDSKANDKTLIKERKIVTIPAVSVSGVINGYITLKWVYEFSGSVEVSATVVSTFTMKYQNGKVSRSLNRDIRNFSLKIEAQFKTGPKFQIYFVLEILGFQIRFVEFSVGVYLKATGSTKWTQLHNSTKNSLNCIDATLKVEVGLEGKIGVVKVDGLSWTAYEDFKVTFGPWNLLSGHWDDLVKVSKCTLKDRKVTITVDKTSTDYTYDVGKLIPTPKTPSKSGYTFKGWYVNTKASGLPGSDYKFDFLKQVMPYCGKDGVLHIYAKLDPIPPESVKLDKTSATIYTNNTNGIQLHQTVKPANAVDTSVKWTSSNKNVATVSSSGKVTPVAAGTATITCTSKYDSSKKATCKITVKQYVNKVTLSANADEIYEGETLQISAAVSPTDSSNQQLSWSSSNSSVATVNQSGLVTGVKSGTTVITATATDRSTVSGKYTVEILLPVTGITLDKTTATIYTNNTAGLQLNPTLTPAAASLASVGWETSNASVATVSKTGVVKPVAPGTATITCRSKSDGSVTATCTVTVKQYVESIGLQSSLASIAADESLQLSATVLPNNATDKSLQWTSSDTSVVTVDGTGRISGVGGGTAMITATAKDGSGVSGSIKITVVALPASTPEVPVTGVTVNSTSMTVYTVDKTAQVTASVTPANADQSMIWASSNESAATIDNTGKVTLIRGGSTILTGRSTADPHKYVNVNMRVVQSVESITISGEKVIDSVGGTTTLTAVVLPEIAENKAVTWSSNTPSVATVDQNGKVTGVSNGVAKITATAKDGSNVKGETYVKVGKDPIPVETITLDYTELSRYTNEKDGVVLTPMVLPDYADDLSVIWSSSDEQVAVVDRDGRVNFSAPGHTTITCRSVMSPDVTATCEVTVKQYVEQIILEADRNTLIPGETAQLQATVYPSNASDKTISWSSADSSIATVDQSGLVTAVGYGDTQIICTANDGSGASTAYGITVEKELQLVVSQVNGTVYTQGDQTCDIAYVTLTNASVQRMAAAGNSLTWSMEKNGSGDTRLSVFNTTLNWNGTPIQTSAALLSGGTFPTAGTETYTVTCRAGAFEDSVEITVLVDGTEYAQSLKLRDVQVGANTFAAQIGESVLLPASPYSADGKPAPANMSIAPSGDVFYRDHASESAADDGLAVSFDESGVYTAKVRYTKGNLSYDVTGTFNIADENGIVRMRVESVELDHNTLRLVEGKTAALTATVLPEDAYDSSVTWSSSDNQIATVNSQGLVTAIAPGTALITCVANDGSGQLACCAVSVERYLQLDESELTFTVYTGGQDHVNLDIINISFDSQTRLVEDGLNVTWSVERLAGSSSEIGLSEFAGNREDGVSISGELIKLLRINAAGTDRYRLSCSAGEYTASCIVNVVVEEAALPQSVSLVTNSYSATVNEWFTADFGCVPSPSGTALPEGTSISIDGGRAFWDAMSGLYSFAEPEKLSFEKGGSYTANIVFSGTNYSYSCPISIEVANEDGVVPPVITDVRLSETELLMTTGESRTLVFSAEPSDLSHGTVSWSSTNTAVATVSSSGKVTAIGPGYASVVASIPESDYEAGCLVCVEEGINFRTDDLERTVFVDGATRMAMDTVMLTDNTSARMTAAPEWTLRRVSGISLTLRAEPVETRNTQGLTLYGCNLTLYSVSKEGDTVYELTCSSGSDTKTMSITVHAVNRERVLPASIALDQTVFTADIGELIVLQPAVTCYPADSKLPNGIVVTCEGDTQYYKALNAEDTFVSQSRSTFSFSKAGTYRVNLVFSYSNMRYVVPVTFRIRDANGDVPVQASRVTLNEKSLYMVAGDTAKLEAVFTPIDTTNQNVTWTSSNPTVAAVSADGTVTARANGMATITCTPADEECQPVSCPVKVEDYLTVTYGTTTRTLYVQGDQKNTVGYAKLSEGTVRRLEADGIVPVWTIDTAQVSHSEVFAGVEDDESSVSVETKSLLSGGTDRITVSCAAGSHSWSQTYTLNVVDLGATAPQSVTIRNPEVSVGVNQTVTVDFTPVISPAGASMPEGMRSTGFIGIGAFYDALDMDVYSVSGNLVTMAFTKPGQYLLANRYLLSNLQYITACTINVGGDTNGRGVLEATETSFTVYEGGRSGSVSTVSITDAILYQFWGSEMTWNAERISGDSLTVALKENGSSVDVFVANVLKNGTDVWRVSCTFAGMTEYVDITLTADVPRGALPESIALASNQITGMIGNVITVPLGVICSPAGTMLPDQGDAFWSFSFDRAGEERSNHSIENGMLTVDFTMSGYYTGTLKYRSGNVSYSIPVYFVIQDEEQEIRKPDLRMYVLNACDTVYPEGETGVAIGQVVMAEGLSTYSTGNAVAYMQDASAVWKVTVNRTAVSLSLRRVSANVYDLVLNQMKGDGDVSYTVTCTVDGETYSAKRTLHVAGSSEPRPDATLRHTSYQAAVGEKVSIDNRMYSREDGSVLQSSTELDPTDFLAAIGYEFEENSNDWSMVFYQEGTYHASVSTLVSNLRVEAEITIVVGEKGSETVLTVLSMPKALTAIEEEAFMGVSANVVDLRDSHVSSIGPGAFRNSVDLMKVYIPDSVTSIADDAFYGCLNVTIVCSSGSYAATWAASRDIPVIHP